METYKVVRYAKSNRSIRPTEETGVISGPDAYDMALRLARHWANDPQNKCVNLLRSNADGQPHVLDRIVKAH